MAAQQLPPDAPQAFLSRAHVEKIREVLVSCAPNQDDEAILNCLCDMALVALRAAPPSKQNAAPQQTPHCPPTPALRAAAAGLVTAAEMLEHNDAIFQGKWKKGSKAWSGDFILRTIADAVRQAQDGGDGSYPDVQGYGGNDQ